MSGPSSSLNGPRGGLILERPSVPPLTVRASTAVMSSSPRIATLWRVSRMNIINSVAIPILMDETA
jgi:hypothetical protein